MDSVSQEDAQLLLSLLLLAVGAWRWRQASNWRRISGRVVTRGRAELLQPAGGGHYDTVLNAGPKYFVEYRVRGAVYQIRVNGENSARVGPWVVWRRPSLPKRVTVLVNPEDPNDAVIQRDRDLMPLILAALGLALLASFVFAHLEWYWDGPVYRARWRGSW